MKIAATTLILVALLLGASVLLIVLNHPDQGDVILGSALGVVAGATATTAIVVRDVSRNNGNGHDDTAPK